MLIPPSPRPRATVRRRPPAAIRRIRTAALSGAAALCLAAQSCTPPAEPLRFAVAAFQHETCTFCPGGDVQIEDWTRLDPPASGEELLASGNYLRGFRDQSRAFGDVELVGLTSPVEVFGGSSRSWNARETFDHFVDSMVAELRAAGPVDGVFLALHGAMAVRDIPRPEAEIARRFREVVGPDVPIAATFDLHGNEDAEFLEHADFAFVTKRYPHYDAHLQGERAARALRAAARGEYRSTTATRKPGIITPTVVQWTGAAPSMEIMERARRWEAREPGAYVSVFYGFPWADVPDAGATVHVMTNDDPELANRIADDMADFMWRVREEFAAVELPFPEEAARIVRAAVARGETPVAVGDHSDRPGDATHILWSFQGTGIDRVLYGGISAPAALEALEAAGAAVGDEVSLEIGGFTRSGGEPFPLDGTLSYRGPGFGYPEVAVVRFGDGNAVLLTPAYTQVRYPEAFEAVELDPAEFDVFVVKSRVHFRRGFDETGFARTIVVVEAPGPFVGTTFLNALPYRNVELSTLYPYGIPLDRREEG
jgi:microcystin degradation protein MlrC